MTVKFYFVLLISGLAGLLTAFPILGQEPLSSASNASVKAKQDPERDRTPSDLPKIEVTETLIELNIDESQKIEFSNKSSVLLKLVGITEQTDSAVKALRRATVEIELNGKRYDLISGNYQLPVALGPIQIDAPVVKAYVDRSGKNSWGIKKDVRFRLWPKGSPWLVPGSFVYPIRQKLLASSTQMNNEPVYVDGGERPGSKTQYYHYGLDFGGAEGCAEALSAVDALVVSAADKTLAEYRGQPVEPRYDVLYLLDGRGWFYRYSHLKRIDVHPGQKVKKGEVLGILGKEGSSGGWSHLHFGILTNQTGLWGNHQAWPYIWEAWVNEYRPELTAVARPHQVGIVGKPVRLSGELSKSHINKKLSFEWILSNGKRIRGETAEMTYSRPGYYSEILKVTDSAGNTEYDNTQVEIFDPKTFSAGAMDSKVFPASIHLAYWPTMNIKTNQPVTFKVRSFRTKQGGETIDFGDGGKPVFVQSDGNTVKLDPNGYATVSHSFEKPGTYLVRAEHISSNGLSAVTHVFVKVK